MKQNLAFFACLHMHVRTKKDLGENQGLHLFTQQ